MRRAGLALMGAIAGVGGGVWQALGLGRHGVSGAWGGAVVNPPAWAVGWVVTSYVITAIVEENERLAAERAEIEAEELALMRADPLLWEQELDVRPEVARSLETATGRRRGRRYWRSRHGHLYALELADRGSGAPALATVFGFWDRYEPRPPEHEIDADLADFCLWVAEVSEGMEVEDVRRVLDHASIVSSWPEGSVRRCDWEPLAGLPGYPWDPHSVEVEGLRMAYVETGSGLETMLMLHGEPTSGYLYRRMVPSLAEDECNAV